MSSSADGPPFLFPLDPRSCISNLRSNQPFTSFSIRCTTGYTRQIHSNCKRKMRTTTIFLSIGATVSHHVDYLIFQVIFLSCSSKYQVVGLCTPHLVLVLPMLQTALLLLAGSAHCMSQLTLTIVLALIVTDLPTNNTDLSEIINIDLGYSVHPLESGLMLW